MNKNIVTIMELRNKIDKSRYEFKKKNIFGEDKLWK